MFRALLYSSSGGKIALYGIWYHHTEKRVCDDTRCCTMQFSRPDDEHIVLGTCRGINKLMMKQEFVL